MNYKTMRCGYEVKNMNVSEIDINYLEFFDLGYDIAHDVFSVNPIEASPRQQKKIRTWLEKTYISGETFPDNVKKYISKEVCDAKFIEFLKSCHDQIELNEIRAKQQFEKFTADLSEKVKSALWQLFETDVYTNNFCRRGNDVALEIENGGAFRRTIILKNASCVPEGNADCLSFSNGSFIKQDDNYCLVGEAEDYENEITTPFSIRFTDVDVEVEIFNACSRTFADNPWLQLQCIASDILGKYSLPGCYFNEKENEILPLTIEISKLSIYIGEPPKEFENPEFPLLKGYANKYRYDKILSLLEMLEKEYFNDIRKDKIISKITSKLNKKNYEPLWREIYNMIEESQSEYPVATDVCCTFEELNEARTNIQKLMESHGYTGIYPNYVKYGKISNIRLAESYDMTYFIGMEKNVVYHIHCTEEYFNGHLMIEFLCGTALLRKDETAEDIYSCLFNANGRRLFHTVSYESNYINELDEVKTDNMEQRVQIAVKKAELIKLSKEERKEYVGFDISYFHIFLWASIVAGGLFSILMNLSMMILGVIILLVSGKHKIIPEMFTDFPWIWMIVLAWIGFGAPIGLITVLTKRK